MDALMAKEEPKTFVNTLMDQDLLAKLDEMVKRREMTRAQFVRWLIRQAAEEDERVERLKDTVIKGRKVGVR